MSAVRVGPIPFSAPLARRAHDGSKTQTRRIVKPAKDYNFGCELSPCEIAGEVNNGNFTNCPYGKPGDLLYAKEDYYQYGHWEPVEGVKTKGGRQKWKFVPDSEEILFDPPEYFRKARCRNTPDYSIVHKRLGRFMPRKYSRTLLEITDVRVERLNEISEADAVAEGIERVVDNSPFCGPDCWRDYSADGLIPFDGDKPIASFRSLWESINGAGTFDDRWVWVICFKRVQP